LTVTYEVIDGEQYEHEDIYTTMVGHDEQIPTGLYEAQDNLFRL